MVLTKNDINATWRAMESLVDEGKARKIGISNFNCQHIRQILSIARIRPTSLQVGCHPHLSQVKLLRFAREAGIRVTGECSYIMPDQWALIISKYCRPGGFSQCLVRWEEPHTLALEWQLPVTFSLSTHWFLQFQSGARKQLHKCCCAGLFREIHYQLVKVAACQGWKIIGIYLISICQKNRWLPLTAWIRTEGTMTQVTSASLAWGRSVPSMSKQCWIDEKWYLHVLA